MQRRDYREKKRNSQASEIIHYRENKRNDPSKQLAGVEDNPVRKGDIAKKILQRTIPP